MAGERRRSSAGSMLAAGRVCAHDATHWNRETARALAATIAGHPADTIRRIKEELVSGTGDAFEAALRDEALNELACFATPEVRARLQAFADRKRGRSV